MQLQGLVELCLGMMMMMMMMMIMMMMIRWDAGFFFHSSSGDWHSSEEPHHRRCRHWTWWHHRNHEATWPLEPLEKVGLSTMFPSPKRMELTPNVARLAKMFIENGAAGIHIEDVQGLFSAAKTLGFREAIQQHLFLIWFLRCWNSAWKCHRLTF